MTTPTKGLRPASDELRAVTNHTITLINRFGNTITAPVVYVKDLGDGRAEVHVESNFYIEEGTDLPATYATSGQQARGKYKVDSKEFTERQTYIYKGLFVRASKGVPSRAKDLKIPW